MLPPPCFMIRTVFLAFSPNVPFRSSTVCLHHSTTPNYSFPPVTHSLGGVAAVFFNDSEKFGIVFCYQTLIGSFFRT